MNTKTLFVLGAVCLSSISAYAFPIAAPGTEGFSVIVAGTDPVIATYRGNSASYSNDLYLNGNLIFNNLSSPVGATANLGTFTPGTELIFKLFVNNTQDSFFTGPATRNADGSAHARVQDNWLPGETLVSFEDLYNGPFDFNDLSFSFTNTRSTSGVPDGGSTLALFGLALGGVAAARRKTGIWQP